MSSKCELSGREKLPLIITFMKVQTKLSQIQPESGGEAIVYTINHIIQLCVYSGQFIAPTETKGELFRELMKKNNLTFFVFSATIRTKS